MFKFSDSSTMTFKLPESGDYRLTLRNLDGSLAQEIAQEFGTKGIHKVQIPDDHISEGVYRIKLQQGEYSEEDRIIFSQGHSPQSIYNMILDIA
jgi:hypothetical protein